jgi:hypothetical protein
LTSFVFIREIRGHTPCNYPITKLLNYQFLLNIKLLRMQQRVRLYKHRPLHQLFHLL